MTFLLVKPIFIIVASLSIIWDFQVFNQVWIMLKARPSPDYYLLGVHLFVESFRLSQYRLGERDAVVMVLLMLGAVSPTSVADDPDLEIDWYRRRTLRVSFDARNLNNQRLIADAIGPVVLAVMIFPAVDGGDGVQAQLRRPRSTLKWIPSPWTLDNFDDASTVRTLWDNVANSVIIVSVVVVALACDRPPQRLAIVGSLPSTAARRSSPDYRRADIPATALIIPLCCFRKATTRSISCAA